MFTFNIAGNNIVGSVNGEAFSINYKKETWDDMVSLQGKFNQVSTVADAKEVVEIFTKLTTQTREKAVEEITPELEYRSSTDTYHLKHNGKVSPVPLPPELVEKIQYAHEKGLPVEPLIKFTVKAMRNPKIYKTRDTKAAAAFLDRICGYVFETFVSPELFKKFVDQGFSEEVAEEMATVPQTPITMEGLLSTKKVVSPEFNSQRYKFVVDEDGNPKKVLRGTEGVSKEIDEDTGQVTVNDPQYAEDWVFTPYVMGRSGDPFYCGSDDKDPKGHVIRVGKEMRLPDWSFVNTNDTQACVKGLHTGNHDYINTFENDSNVTLDCFVCPSEVGAIPYHDAPGVLRVRTMFIYGIKSRKVENRNIYHSSKYAELSDERWEQLKKEVIANYDKELEDYKKGIEAKKEMLID